MFRALNGSLRVSAAIALLFLSTAVTPLLQAQGETTGTAMVAGTVLDPAGSPIQQAAVAVKNQASGAVRSTTTGPDGHFTVGIEKHIQDLAAMFVYAPDTRIKQHPISFGNATGEWTAVTGIMEGTFSKPMPIGNGKFIQPTGKSFKLPMCTIGHWVNGIMNEEYLFWDNQTYMNQLGLGK